jgi:REase_MTES_1575
MNFGPINQKGGEKRLNVIVSRARQHMVVVSSIEASAITNTYNDGANALRRFLGYAQAVSRGDAEAAARILATSPQRPAESGRPDPLDSSNPINNTDSTDSRAAIDALAAALRSAGLVVAENVGQSAFRCDLALRRPEDHDYQVAVLVDTPSRVAAQPLGERLTSNPAVLVSAGWQVAQVLLKDWHDHPERVVAQLLEKVGPRQPVSKGPAADGSLPPG